MAIITLTTDFGTRDGYVGAVKGVLAKRAPGATVVDLAHEVPPGDIAHAAWVVASACLEFPINTIHVVVVDPGVGSARRPVIAQAFGHWFVGPDNGVFAYLTAEQAWAIETKPRGYEIWFGRASRTFHGRDVFAPAAAMLVNDHRQVFGVEIRLAGKLPWGDRPDGEGRIVHVDRYGNLISDLPALVAGDTVAIDGRRLPIVATYSDVPPGELLAYVGSQRTIEIAVRDGRADRMLDAPRGTPVVPVPGGEPFR